MVWTGYAPDQINWDIWPCDIWRGMFLCAGLTHRSLFYSISSTWSSFCPWKLYSEIHNLRKRRQRRGRSLRKCFKFTFAACEHRQTGLQMDDLHILVPYPCAPGVLRMLSKCHCEADYSLHRSSCVRQHAPTIRLPCFSIPARSLVTVLASLMSALRAAEVTRAQEKVAGGGINRRPTRH